MITKHEIMNIVRNTGFSPYVIEKDYVLGWILAAINNNKDLKDTFIFKGGTCLKKCYFESYRLSEDLDFTLINKDHLDVKFLQDSFTHVAEWVYLNTGIEIFHDLLSFEIYLNPRGNKSCQGKLYYRGPVSPSGKRSPPRIKLDLTNDEIIVDKTNLANVKHSYSDYPTNGIKILSYSYVEVFAEKIRALKERTKPRDLYDVIHFYRRPESFMLAKQLREILEAKCLFKQITFPTLAELELHKEICANGWEEQLAHQLPALPNFENFWEELTGFFEWLDNPINIANTKNSIPAKFDNEVNCTPDALRLKDINMFIFETICFAAINYLSVEIYYQEETNINHYLVEVYALRENNQNAVYLYTVVLSEHKEEVRIFRIEQIKRVIISHQHYKPRYLIELM